MNPVIVGGVLSLGKSLINKWFPDPEEANKREAELNALIVNQDSQIFESLASVVKEEAKSDHWIVAAWRPITMLTFTAIIANNYILYPYLSLFFDNAVKLDIPPDMWDLLKLGIGGYVVGRSAEKSVKAWKENK